MKNILIFSNPFGYGPSGKALNIANYIYHNNKKVAVHLCGGSYFKSIAGNAFDYIELDERNEQDILNAINKIPGEKYIIASQNRFAVKVAKNNNIPCAFLDGLAWFWKDIPEDHYFADIIFWLNYPNIKKKIPVEHKEKIFIIHGIVNKIDKLYPKNKRKGKIFYIGGCKNTLTPLPENYLNLVNALFELFFRNNKGKIKIAFDIVSADFYRRKACKICEYIKVYEHENFIREVAKSKGLITNGGQTSALEALSVETPTSFFLPINLSQAALIKNIMEIEGNQSMIYWEKYCKLPKDFYKYNEKDAIDCLDRESKFILNDKLLFKRLFADFSSLILNNDFITGNGYLSYLGTTGVEDIYKIIVSKWKI